MRLAFLKTKKAQLKFAKVLKITGKARLKNQSIPSENRSRKKSIRHVIRKVERTRKSGCLLKKKIDVPYSHRQKRIAAGYTDQLNDFEKIISIDMVRNMGASERTDTAPHKFSLNPRELLPLPDSDSKSG